MFTNKYVINIAIIIKLILIAYPSIAAEGTGMPQMVIPDFMPQLVWLIVIFSLLYFSMKYIALPRITEIITNRDLKIVNDLEKAEEIKKILGVQIDIFGFDLGSGLPKPKDYRDLPYQWKEGFFSMNKDDLIKKLRKSKLILGNIEETSKNFFSGNSLMYLLSIWHSGHYMKQSLK